MYILSYKYAKFKENPCVGIDISSPLRYKRDDFEFEIVIFPFLDGDVPGSISYEFFNSSDLLEHLAMLQASTFAINF